MASKRHLIVGAGTAGANAIRTIRQSGSQDEIALVSAEHPYSRMVLPYYLEEGISETHADTLSPNLLEKWGVELHLGRRAISLDTGAGKLKLDNEDELSYDNLLIATGSSAMKLDIPGANSEGVYSFWTLADAKGLNSHIGEKAHVVLIGAGFIAFTILNGIMKRAGQVTIVEVEQRILPRMVDDAGAGLVAARLQQRGVTLKTGAGVQGIEDKGGRKRLSFSDGSSLECDIVVMATGVKPNLDWLEGSGIEIAAGIVVDGHMRSNVPNVYAAGDVAEGKNRITGKREVHAIEPTAMEHGRVAGANMAGQNVDYPGSLMMNIVSVGGIDIASFGAWDDAGAESIEALREDRSAYRKYLFQGDSLTGAIYVSDSSETWSGNDLGMLKGLVQSGQSLGKWKKYLSDNPFEIKRPYLANRTVSTLLPATLLGGPSQSPRA